MGGSAGLRFCVLGPLQVHADGHPIPVGGAKQRRLQAALVANANAVVSADRLIDVLWEDAPPDGAAAALAKDVYRLRMALGSATTSPILLTQPPGYRLSVEPGQLDADEFASLVSDGQRVIPSDPAQALRLLDQALALWRGPAWAEFADQDFARPLVSRLDGLRALALEQRADAMLALGRQDEVVAELQQAIADYPLRERPQAQLMRALYLSGRHAEALSAYRAFRRYLMDEVGLEPSASLRELERDILQQKAELTVSPPTTGVPAPGRSVGLPVFPERFVGRRVELSWLEVLLGQSMGDDRPMLALLSGEAGIGKTTVATVFGRAALARGCAVAYSRCDPVGGVHPALEGLGVTAPSPAAAGAWSTTMDAAVAGLAAFGDGRPVVLIVDDVDRSWTDAVGFLQQLASVRRPFPLCALAVARAVPGDGWPSRPGGGEHHRVLHGLTLDEVGELLEAVSGAARPAELVESVWAETGGSPSLVTAIGQRFRHLDIRTRADQALARAETARHGLEQVQHEIARGVLAGVALATPTSTASARPDTAPPGPAVCPYKGLASFGQSDAMFFRGRERLVATLVAKLAVERFLAVIGPSGSGKSSLVAAGLLPALAAAGLPGSDRWPCLLIRPGSEPIRTLARALAPLAQTPPLSIQQQLETDPGQLESLANRALDTRTPSTGRLVLIIDQFEEAFTACQDPAARERFIRVLAAGAADPAGRVSVALIMRADYYGACADHTELARMVARSQLLVPAMTDAELRRVVTEPAQRAGLLVEDGLADAVCRDAAGQNGALPLISTALLETWAGRSGSTLTLAGYLMAGGVRGAVARLAEGVYDGFDGTERVIARQILLRLADPGGVSSDVRRRARHAELATSAVEENVLATLIDRRLATAYEDTVEVAHEALLREWPRLAGWLAEDRAGRRMHRQLADAAAAWQADGRDEAGLYRGIRLQAAREWAASHRGDANRLEQDFLTASEATQESALRGARRTARRLRGLAVGLAVFLIAALTSTTLAAQQRSTARREAVQAETSRLATLARTLPNNQRDLALLLGAEGYRLHHSDESVGGLQTALVQTPPGLDRVIRYRSSTWLPHLDTSGRLLAVPGVDGTVTIDDLTAGRVLHTLTWPTPREFAVFSGDDTLVAAGGSDGQIALWDLASGQPAGPPLPAGGGIAHAVFDPHDHDRLYVITNRGPVTIWDRRDPQHPRQLATLTGIASDTANGNAPNLTISPDGRLLAAGDIAVGVGSGPAQVWDTRTGRPVHSFPGSIGVFAADGVTLPFGYGGDTVLINARTGLREDIVPNTAAAPLATLSPDGRRIAVSEQIGTANAVVVYDLKTHHPIGQPLKLHGNAAYPVGFLPDGRLITTGNNEAAIWTIGASLPPIAVPLWSEPYSDNTAFVRAIFLPHPGQILLRGTGMLLLNDQATGKIIGPLLHGAVTGAVAPSPDGRLIAAADTDGNRTAIWDLNTGTRLGQLPDLPAGGELSWSPLGNLVATNVGDSVRLWNVSDPRRPTLAATIATATGMSRTDYLLFTPDGRRLITASDGDKRITMINIPARRVEWSLTVSDLGLRQVALAPDGQTIAVDSGDSGKGRLTLYRATDATPRRSIAIQSYGGLAYLHGGRWLLVTGNKSTPGAQLYDAATLEPIGVPFPTTDPYGDPVAVNGTGTMFSEAEGADPPLWDVDPDHWQTIACTTADRNLTQAEWHQYLPSQPYHRTCAEWPPGQ